MASGTIELRDEGTEAFGDVEAHDSGGVIWSEMVFDSCLGLVYETILVSNQSGGDYLSLTGS